MRVSKCCMFLMYLGVVYLTNAGYRELHKCTEWFCRKTSTFTELDT